MWSKFVIRSIFSQYYEKGALEKYERFKWAEKVEKHWSRTFFVRAEIANPKFQVAISKLTAISIQPVTADGV